MLPLLTLPLPAATVATSALTLDLPLLAVAWGLATWWSARWLTPGSGSGRGRDRSADRAAQEAVDAGRCEQRRGHHQRREHHSH